MTNRKAILCLAAVLLAGGCGGSKTSGPQVAALPGTSAAAAAAKPSPSDSTADRQLPLGATQAQIDRAYAAYYGCWIVYGVTATTKNGYNGGPLLSYKLNPKKYQAAVDACADREPLNPPELDPQQNPAYWDQLRDEQKCVQAKGLPLEVQAGQQGLWVRPATDANFRKVRTDAAMQVQRDCEIQAFTKK